MKAVAQLAGVLILLSAAHLAQAQGARGGFAAPSGARSAAPAQSGSIGLSRPQAPAPPRSFSPPRPQPAGPRAPHLTAPRPAPRESFHGGRVFVPPFAAGRTPPFILGTAPLHGHRPWFFHRHPGILIIEVPWSSGTSVVTEYMPGVIEQGPSGPPESAPGDSRLRGPGKLAPFDPTPQEVVDRMLVLAKVKKTDVVYDLGSGDGRIVIAAAKKYGVHAVGFEIDPGLVKLAQENARRQGVEKLVEIHEQDFLTADVSPASVVTLYLSEDGNLAVRPQLLRQLKPNARVVSYTYAMGDWQPKVAETYRDAAGNSHQLYLWEIGEPMIFSNNPAGILQPQPNRAAPLIIEVK